MHSLSVLASQSLTALSWPAVRRRSEVWWLKSRERTGPRWHWSFAFSLVFLADLSRVLESEIQGPMSMNDGKLSIGHKIFFWWVRAAAVT